ncbi:MAG: hypothetical protein QNJ41_20030 [Xenococcaceae cyanobacterium MO_188.B32]|nr:hypothetical protein [Xenococcaceae cyanobacterium MO_188.B32]
MVVSITGDIGKLLAGATGTALQAVLVARAIRTNNNLTIVDPLEELNSSF